MSRTLANLSLAFGLLGWLFQAEAQVPHILGTWTLNPEATQVPGGIPEGAMETREYSLRDDGFVVGLAVRIGPDRRPTFLQYAAKSDGREYPEYESNTLANLQISGATTPMMYSETVVDEYTVAIIDKRDGRVTLEATRSVSEDGQTMTISYSVNGSDGEPIPILLVYDRVEAVAR